MPVSQKAKPQAAHRQADRWIENCWMRLRLGQFMKTAADWLAVYLFCFGAAILIVKLALPQFWPHVLWLGLGTIPVAGFAWWLSGRDMFSRTESIAILDSRLHAGGLLMTLAESPNDQWLERLPHLESLWQASLPQFWPLRFAKQTAFPAVFLMGVCLVPEREVEAAPALKNTAGTKAAAELEELLEQLDELEILEEEEEKELRDEIQKLVEETRQTPLTHEKWETVDALESMMRMRADTADANLSKAQESLAALQRASKADAKLMTQESVEQLAKDVKEALEKLAKSGAFNKLSPQLREQLERLMKSGQFELPDDPEARQKMLDELSEFLDQESDKLSKLHEKCENCGKPGGT